MSANQDTVNLAKKFIDHTTNEKGDILANVYESEAFKVLFDPSGAAERKLRLPRRQEIIFNRYDPATHLFQKVYYHPALLQEDETKLRNIFYANNAKSELLGKGLLAGALVGYLPLMYQVSKKVSATGCGLVTAGYGLAYYFGVKPYNVHMLQQSLNKDAEPFADKYGVSTDDSKYFE